MNPPPMPPSPPIISQRERNWAMGAHASSLLGWVGVPFANIIAPLVIYLIKRDEMPFVADQAKECLNFQITLTLGLLVAGMLALLVVGLPLLIALPVIGILFTIIAAVRAADGVHYRYPLTIRFVP